MLNRANTMKAVILEKPCTADEIGLKFLLEMDFPLL